MTLSMLDRSTPEQQGVTSESILSFVDAMTSPDRGLHSLIVFRHGHVVAEGWMHPYRRDLPHMLFSLSKSFTSTAAGLAVSEGLLSVDDLVTSFFPGELPEVVSENLANMRVKHLLSMSTGHAEDTMAKLTTSTDSNWARAFLSAPVENEPGSRFVYNSGASYMVSAIVQNVVGEPILDYLKPRLLQPLGIEGVTWERSPTGVCTGGWGLNLTTEAIAKFGALYLNRGCWNGKRLLSEKWIDAATTMKVSNGDDPNNDWGAGYGYQFWRCQHNAYRGDGAFGQFCIVMPDKDAVVAMTGGMSDLAASLSQVWEHLLPGFQDSPLKPNNAAHEALISRWNKLQRPRPVGASHSRALNQLQGRTFTFAPNPGRIRSLQIDPIAAGLRLKIEIADRKHAIDVGADGWIENTSKFGFGRWRDSAISSTLGWGDDGELTIKMALTETPFIVTLKLRAGDRRLTVDFVQNVYFDAAAWPQLESEMIDGV
jgi:CubicO group peptidase (beta-lactamase class C family)